MHHQMPMHADTEHEVVAHFSPAEMKELILLQGGYDKDHRTGLPTFKHLFNLFNHDTVRPMIHDWARNGFRDGGEVEGLNHFIRASGRNGDVHAAVIPRPLAELFDAAIGGKSINPRTGKREYFLGGLLNGFKNILGGIAKPFASIGSSILRGASPMLGNLASTGLGALGSAVGMPALGTALGGTANSLVSGLANQGADMLNSFGGGGGAPDQGGEAATGAPAAPNWRQHLAQMGQTAAPMLAQHAQQYLPQMGQQVGSAAHALASHMGIPAQYADQMRNMAAQHSQNLAQQGLNYGADRFSRAAQQWGGAAA